MYQNFITFTFQFSEKNKIGMKNKLLLLCVFICSGSLISSASCPGDTAKFTSNAPKCISDPVNFTNTSTINPGDGILGWKWNFGDSGSGINNTSTLQNPSHLFSAVNQAFSVKLVVTYTLGCKDSVHININIQSLVVVNAGSDIISCKNNLTDTLSGTSSIGGQIWSGSGAFSSITSLNPIYTPTTAAKVSGTDTLVLTSLSSPYCPNVSDTVVLFFNPGPTVSVGSNLSVCKDTSGVPVSATFTLATGGLWHTTGTGGTFEHDTAASTIYFPSSSDTAAGAVILYMESTTGNGICSPARDSLTITFTPTPDVLIKSNDSVCSGSPITLNVAVSTGVGLWSSSGSGTFLPTNTINGLYYYPSAGDILAGVVTLKFQSGNNGGCQSYFDTLDVFIKSSPTAAFTSVSACVNDDVAFTDASAGTIVSWTWSFGDLSLPSFLSSPTHSYSSCGSKNVTLLVTASNGCMNSGVQSIIVYCDPTANYSASGSCLNEGTAFTNTSSVSGSTISASNWNFGDLTTSNLTDPTHSFPSSGLFLCTLTVQSSQGCVDSITQTISVVSPPVAAFTANDNTAETTQHIIFQNQSSTASSWWWDFGDLTAGSSLQSPSHIFTAGGYYNVCLTATDLNGCQDIVCQQEIVSTIPLGPSAFSPNGDGQNDVFYAYGGPFKSIEFKVYNNWGELIFESTKQWAGWDGKYKGVDQAVGVYVYTVAGITEDDKEYWLSGDVTLLR